MTEEKISVKAYRHVKNGMLKRRELHVKDDAVKERGRAILSRLGKKKT